MRAQSSARHHSRFPTSLVSAMRIFFPALLLFWMFLFTFAKTAPTHKLRGSQQFELPLLQPGDISQKNVRKATEVRRKTIVPNHAIIVAGHAVVRLNKMASAGKIHPLRISQKKVHNILYYYRQLNFLGGIILMYRHKIKVTQFIVE